MGYKEENKKLLINVKMICQTKEDAECVEILKKEYGYKFDSIIYSDIEKLEIIEDHNYMVAFFEDIDYNDSVINYFKKHNKDLKVIDSLWTKK